MAQHMRNNDDKHASLLASAQNASSAARRSRAGEARQISADMPRASEAQAPQEAQGTRGSHVTQAPGSSRDGRRSRDGRSRERGAHGTHGGRGGHGGRARKRRPNSLAAFLSENSVYILSVVAVVIIVALMIVMLRGFVSPAGEDNPDLDFDMGVATENNPDGYDSPLDWNNLENVDGRSTYVVDGQVKSRLGIDVSENQHDIDWQAVADDGIEFAMIRLGYRGATEGKLYVDERYETNIDGALAAGLDCGVYFFSQAKTVKEAEEEADYVLEQLGDRQIRYPIAFDSEGFVNGVEEVRTASLSRDEMTNIAEAFCKRVEAAGHRALVYGNLGDMSRYHYDNMADRYLWWAEYDVVRPSAPIGIVMWQYANDGQIAGIETAVDMNIDLTLALAG